MSLQETFLIAPMRKDTSVLANSKEEFCRSGSRIGEIQSEFLVPVIGGKGSEFMNAKIKYSDEPIGPIEVVEDFLPLPEELAFSEETVKVTITLSKESVDFFKSEAKNHNTQYQRMIRRLLDAYTRTHSRPVKRP